MSGLQQTALEDLAQRFAKAAEARDTDALIPLYHPDAKFWNNVLRHVSDTSRIIEITRLEAQVITRYDFDNLRCTLTDEGFVLQMTVAGETRSGKTFAVETCLVAQASDGLITRIDEYVDAAQAGPIFEELLAPPGPAS